MPSRNNNQKTAGRGSTTGRGPGRGAGRTANGRGGSNNNAGGRSGNTRGGRGGGRGGGRSGGMGGNRSTNGKSSSTTLPDSAKMDEGLDECEQQPLCGDGKGKAYDAAALLALLRAHSSRRTGGELGWFKTGRASGRLRTPEIERSWIVPLVKLVSAGPAP